MLGASTQNAQGVLLVLLWGLISGINNGVRAIETTHTTVRRESASIEPYVASWCAKEFYEELPTFNGYHMALLRDNHIEIEGFLAQWCLAQFPNDLSWQDLDALKKQYLPIEDTLQHWATRSLAILDTSDRRLEPPVVDLVPYVGEWCLSQFPTQLQHLQLDVFAQLAADHAPLQPVLTEWCMAQFPLDIEAPAMMEGINYSIPIESELIQWSFTLSSTTATVNAVQENCHSVHQQQQRDLGIIFLSISLLLSVSAVAFLLIRGGGRGSCIQSNTKEYDIDPTEVFGDQSSEGTMTSSVEPC